MKLVSLSPRDTPQGDLLFSSYAVTTHSLPRIRDLSQQILGSYVSNTNNSKSNRKRSPVPLEPPSRGGNHDLRSCKDPNNMPVSQIIVVEEHSQKLPALTRRIRQLLSRLHDLTRPRSNVAGDSHFRRPLRKVGPDH
jgi:hypothetical protein